MCTHTFISRTYIHTHTHTFTQKIGGKKIPADVIILETFGIKVSIDIYLSQLYLSYPIYDLISLTLYNSPHNSQLISISIVYPLPFISSHLISLTSISRLISSPLSLIAYTSFFISSLTSSHLSPHLISHLIYISPHISYLSLLRLTIPL